MKSQMEKVLEKVGERSEAEKIEWDFRCFGCRQENLIESKPSFYSNLMYAMAILSDAQATLEMRNDKEEARQFINRAKLFIQQEMNEQRAKEEETYDWRTEVSK